jgi:hypothetical protein
MWRDPRLSLPELASRLALEGHSAPQRPIRDAKYPENFPVHGNSVSETGSHESPHTANDRAGRRRISGPRDPAPEMHRSWLLCPGCSRRSAVLYAAVAFRCRRRLALSYRSQCERAPARIVLRANKIRPRLAWPCGVLSRPGSRPCRMHRNTYRKLTAKLAKLTAAFLSHARVRFPTS